MVEILIISILITTWLFTVWGAISHAEKANENVKQTVIANQLATEWAELIYQLRNTNILEYYYNDDFDKNITTFNNCRLAYNYWECAGQKCQSNIWSSEWCIPDVDKYIMKKWNYYITKEWKIMKSQCDIDNHAVARPEIIKQKKYAICLNSWVRVPCPEWHEAWHDESKYGKFYRMIEWIWIYDMSENSKWWKEINSDFCSSINTQEYRFCSRVAREWGGWYQWWWEVEICSTMTNFARIPWE